MAESKEKKKKIKAYAPRRMCTKCGARLGEHSDRFSCGKCGYTEFKRAK